MLVYLAIALYGTSSVIALLFPKKGLLLFPLLSLCYPTWLLYGIMPLNAGLDDIFLTCLFIGALVRSAGRIYTRWPVIISIVFCAIVIMGDVSSMAIGSDVAMDYVLKRWLKTIELIFLVFAICAVADSPQFMKKIIYSFLFAACISALLIVFYSKFPYAYNPFQIPPYLLEVILGSYKASKPLGPFQEHDIAGGVLGFGALLSYFTIRLGTSSIKRIMLIAVVSIIFLGLLLSGSRSGWGFALIPLVIATLFSRNRVWGCVLLILMAGVAYLSYYKFERVQERFERTKTQITSESALEVTSGRVYEWRQAVSEPSVLWLFLGTGFAVAKGHPHSNYIAMLVHTGLIGLIFWIFYYKAIFKKTLWIMRSEPDSELRAIFTGVFWAYIGYLFYFLTCTPMMWAPVRTVDFFLMTLLFVRFQQLQDESFYYPYDYQHSLNPDYYVEEQLA